MIYQGIYDLIEQYVFGAVQGGTYQELVCIAVSVMAVLFVMALPFVLVYRVIRMWF